jgi:hypothetical protein
VVSPGRLLVPDLELELPAPAPVLLCAYTAPAKTSEAVANSVT